VAGTIISTGATISASASPLAQHPEGARRFDILGF